MTTKIEAMTTRLPVRTGGIMRKTFPTGKKFAAWLDETDYKVAAEYARKTGIEVFLLLNDEEV
jgi:hypothetical protein